MVGMDVGVDMHVGMWAGNVEDTYSVSLLLSSFAFPYSMVFGCIQKNLHCYIQLALDICYISGNSFLCSVVLLVSSAYFLDVQIYSLHPFFDNNYNIVYCNRLLGVSFHMFLYCCILHFPLYSYIYFYVPVYISLQIYTYLYFPNMGNFLFSLSVVQLVLPFFVLCLELVFLQVNQ